MENVMDNVFTLSEYGSMFDDPYDYFAEFGNRNPIQDIKDKVTGTKKKNVLQKCREVIRHCIERIVAALRRFKSWIVNTFSRNKAPKVPMTIDQVFDEVGVKPNKIKQVAHKIKIPWSEESKTNSIPPKNLDMMMKPILMSISDDGKTVTITPKDYIARKFTGSKSFVSGDRTDDSPHDPRSIFAIFKIMSNQQLLDTMDEIADQINDGNITATTISAIDQLFRESIVTLRPSLKYKVKVDDVSRFNQLLLKVSKSLEVLDDPDPDLGDKKIVDALNRLSLAMLQLQIGSELIGKCMKNVYIMDVDFCETIDTIEKLAQFVNAMLDAGVPQKYIAFNCWMASTKKLRGNADVEKPTWGLGRVVFLPQNKKDVVYKIALNGYGIRSNKSECDIYAKVKAANNADRFAAITWHDENYAAIAMERATIDRSKASKVKGELKAALDQALKKSGVNATMDDQHVGNVGFRGNLPISIDYGMVKRLSDE